MGGLGPGIGGAEWLVIGLVALLVVGPERLPGLLRQLGKWVAKARGMANEFRSSFEDMARQSELDDLRKEVEALRTGQPVRLGAEADAAFKDIRAEFDKPLFADASAPAPVMTPAASEWPDGEPVMLPIADRPLIAAELIEPAPEAVPEAVPAAAPKAAPRKPRAPRTAAGPASKVSADKAAAPKASSRAAPKTTKTTKTAAKPAARKAAPRKSKLDL